MSRKEYNGKTLPEGDYYHIITHGGIGDISWLYSKLCNVELPLFFDVCSEAPFRPRRTGDYLDTLPRLVGWRYIDEDFGGGGKMWMHPHDKGHPFTAFYRTWKDLAIPPNKPTRLECNLWLEQGYKLTDWLPDLETSFHYEFDDDHIKPVSLKRPAVGLHFTGWGDVHDNMWVEAARVLNRSANVYIITAPYDGRAKRLLPQVMRAGSNIIPVVGKPWSEVWATLKKLDYILGHASGLTVLSNVLSIPGAVVNPLVHVKLRNTWNDPAFYRQVQIQTCDQFMAAAFKIAEAVPGGIRRDSASLGDDSDGLGQTLLQSLLSTLPTLTHSSPNIDFVHALGAFRHPKRLLYIGSEEAPLRRLIEGLYEGKLTGRRLEVVQIVDPDPVEDLAAVVREVVKYIPFKPAIRVYAGEPSTEEVRKVVRQAAPFDLAYVRLGADAPMNRVYNALSLSTHLLRPGGGLAAVDQLNAEKTREGYFDFCISRGRTPAIAKTPDRLGLIFQ